VCELARRELGEYARHASSEGLVIVDDEDGWMSSQQTSGNRLAGHGANRENFVS
jgi:hypothetical protein